MRWITLEGTRSPGNVLGMLGRGMLALRLLSPGLLWILGWHMVESGMTLGKAGQLPCLLEVALDPSETLNGERKWQHIQLVLSGSESQSLSHQGNSATFLLQDRAGVLLPHMDEDVDKLECKVSRYFTANTQILWPGLPPRQAQLPTWHLVTISHTDAQFKASTFCFQSAESAQGTGPAIFSGVFSLYTKASRVQVELYGTVLLACSFVMDHAPEALDVRWALRQKGGKQREILKYDGKQRQVTHLHEQVEAFPSEIPGGDASIRLNNVAVNDQGDYFCSVSTAGLYWELSIEVAVVEAPKVRFSPQTPILTLEEGEEEKLVCDVRHYFPLEAHVFWLRERLEGRMMPEGVKNVLFSSHRKNGDETFSFSSYYLLKASLQDDGFRYTCLVEHEGLRFPIRKSIIIRVTEKSGSSWGLLIILIILMVVIFVLLRYLHQVKSMNKTKPY